MLNTLFLVEFSWWWMGFLFPLMPIWYLYSNTKSSSANSQSIHLPFSGAIENNSQQNNSNINVFDFLIKLMIWSCLILSAMRPQFPMNSLQTPTTGRDLFMVIDVSGSMKEGDMMLNNRRVRRMDAVKFIASDFLRQREGDRVGLVFFGLHIATQAPLTYDVQTVADFIENVQYSDLDTRDNSGTIIAAGTVIGDALATTINKLRDADIENKVIILLTDGEDQGSTRAPIEMAEIAKKSNIKIYTIGVSAYRRGVDEDTLKDIAAITNGQYFRARNTYELQQIYKTIDQLEPNEALSEPISPKKEMFFIFLSLAVLFTFLPFILNLITRLFNLNKLFNFNKEQA